MPYKISLIAPESKLRYDALWDVEFRDNPGHATVMSLTPDELDELELALACRRAQLRLPRLTGVVPAVSGQRFDENGTAIGFTGAALRQYDDGAAAVIVTRDGNRFPLDERVEVMNP
jgi:hypothetical protein